jgi:hypothetical protein
MGYTACGFVTLGVKEKFCVLSSDLLYQRKFFGAAHTLEERRTEKL